jgi:drug/metabolite transporter (DMT)-like permease
MEIALITAAVILRIISNPAGNVFQKQLTGKQINPLFINFTTYFILALLCCIIIPGTDFPKYPRDFWIYSLLVGIAGAMGNAFLVKALQGGELSVLGPVNSYKSVVGIITGIFLLNEIPGIWGITGTFLIILGSYFVIGTTDGKFSWAQLKQEGIVYRLLALILTAVEAVFLKKVIIYSSSLVAFIMWCCSGAVFSFLLLKSFRIKSIIEIKKLHSPEIIKIFLLVFCTGVMQFSTNYVFKVMPVGYALALFQLSVILTVILGHKVFREEKLWQKLLGSAIMISGSIIIIILK